MTQHPTGYRDNMAGATESSSLVQGTDMLRQYWGITFLSCLQKTIKGMIQRTELESHQGGCNNAAGSEVQFHGTSQKTFSWHGLEQSSAN